MSWFIVACYYKLPYTGCLIKNRNVFPIVLDAVKFNINVLRFSGENLSLASYKEVILLCSHMGKEAILCPLRRALIPIMRVSHVWVNHHPKAPLYKIVALGDGFSIYNFLFFLGVESENTHTTAHRLFKFGPQTWRIV